VLGWAEVWASGALVLAVVWVGRAAALVSVDKVEALVSAGRAVALALEWSLASAPTYRRRRRLPRP
jgi:hypothetical protein